MLFKVGEQWKDEMRELTLKFDIRLKDSLNQNKTLKARIKQLEVKINKFFIFKMYYLKSVINI